jgi:transcriptional regulator with XRE-family HTH domain
MATSEKVPYEEALGARLRRARDARRLSLKSVEAASEGTITASMLGAYERGEHAITARRLFLLARLYDVSLEELAEGIDEDRGPIESEGRASEPVRFEMEKLRGARGREAQVVLRLVQVVEQRRRRRSPDWA